MANPEKSWKLDLDFFTSKTQIKWLLTLWSFLNSKANLIFQIWHGHMARHMAYPRPCEYYFLGLHPWPFRLALIDMACYFNTRINLRGVYFGVISHTLMLSWPLLINRSLCSTHDINNLSKNSPLMVGLTRKKHGREMVLIGKWRLPWGRSWVFYNANMLEREDKERDASEGLRNPKRKLGGATYS